MSRTDPLNVPSSLRLRVAEITSRTDAIAREHLDEEYAELARRMTAALARKRPSPVKIGDARSWAAGILHAVGWVNFLSEPSSKPHMTTKQLAAAAGVGKGTVASLSRRVRDALDLMPLDPEWTRPSDMLDNPLAWIVVIDGMPVDARQLPDDFQRQLFQDGLIPFVHGASGSPASTGAAYDTNGILSFPTRPSVSDRVEDDGDAPFISLADGTYERSDEMVALHARLQQYLDGNPDATIDELNTALAGVVGEYNRRQRADLGGLSPEQLQSLISSDWQSADSVVRLDESLTLADIEASAIIADARLFMTMLAERGQVKATAKGNLPREFVRAYRDRMPDADTLDSSGFEVYREEELFPLHMTRTLLTLAGIASRTGRSFKLTKQGRTLAADERAGALFATLFQTHFRKLSLAWLDALPEVIELQQLVAFPIYRFGEVGTEWQKAEDLKDSLLLPAVSAAIPPSPLSSPELDLEALLIELRVLQPLVQFGLAEARRPEPRPGMPFERTAYRKSPLFDRFLNFTLPASK